MLVSAGLVVSGLAVAGVASSSIAVAAVGDATFTPLDESRRIVDTRTGGSTFDGSMVGGGFRTPGTTLAIGVAGRVGTPKGASAAVLNITVDGVTEAGFLTVYACDADRPTASNANYFVGRTTATMAITRVSATGDVCVFTSGTSQLIVDVAGTFGAQGFDALPAPQRIADTRSGGTTVDGASLGGGPRASESVLRLPVAGRGGMPASARTAVLTVTATGARDAGYVTLYPCGADRPNASSVNYAVDDTVANTVVTRLADDGTVCLYTFGATDVIVDVAGSVAPSAFTPLGAPSRLLDTRVGSKTIDGQAAGAGQRRRQSAMRVPVAGRGGLPSDVGAVLVNITAQGISDGYITTHANGTNRPNSSSLNVGAKQVVANAAVARVGANGEICVFNWGKADIVIDVVGYLPGSAQVAGDVGCTDGSLLPKYRMVALYGNGSAAGLGALGEQSPEAAAARLEEVAAPFDTASRPVLETFELIATVAQADAGPSGLYREPTGDAEIQRYLDTARRHGLYLVLDIQPGRSDFLTEVKRYEKFLREPDVGIALDPEWRVGPFSQPGRVVGSVSADEINVTADYVSRIVAENKLPDKLFVVHQFQVRMIPDRDRVAAKPGLNMMFHMDGFGGREEKLATWSFVKTGPPFFNGFKLFYDEDRNRFSPADVMALAPSPDLITYQ
jgi:hypothetical protein